MDKKQVQNYIKLMKLMAKYGKHSNAGKLFGSWDKENEIIYISDSCVAFPIPEKIYVENYVAAKCPSLDDIEKSKIDLKKYVLDAWNDSDNVQCAMTTLLVNLDRHEKLANIYKVNNDFGVADKRYIDLISLLPPVLSAYNPYAKNTRSPIVFYTENYISMGYIVLPIHCNIEDTFDRLGFIRKSKPLD